MARAREASEWDECQKPSEEMVGWWKIFKKINPLLYNVVINENTKIVNS